MQTEAVKENVLQHLQAEAGIFPAGLRCDWFVGLCASFMSLRGFLNDFFRS